MGSINDDVVRIRTLFESELLSAETLDALQGIRIRFLGKKGEVTSLLKRLGSLPAEDRPRPAGCSMSLETLWKRPCQEGQRSVPGPGGRPGSWEWLDVTLPGRGRPWGAFHPVAQITQEAIDIFASMGFSVAYGPEVEDDFHNFEGLNIPPHHPARDMQDTFYLENGLLLRTHTSPVEVRSMRRWGAPLRIIIPGKVFRRDSDQTHSPMFHQLEGLLVDENISLAHLKGAWRHSPTGYSAALWRPVTGPATFLSPSRRWRWMWSVSPVRERTRRAGSARGADGLRSRGLE